jgi:hypothetical protein
MELRRDKPLTGGCRIPVLLCDSFVVLGDWERPLLLDGRGRSPQEAAGSADGDTTSGVPD